MASEKLQGILYVTSTPTSVTPEAWNTWYDEVHVPDILATTGFSTAFRYTNITQQYPTLLGPLISPDESQKQAKNWGFLAMYPVRDMAWLGSDEFLSLPVRSEVLGWEGGKERRCFDVAELEMRYCFAVDGVEGASGLGGEGGPLQGKVVVTVCMTPVKDQEGKFDAWYKEEYCRTLLGCEGYLQTRRYRIQKTLSVEEKGPLKFLAVHEFEDRMLDEEGLGRSMETEWSKKVAGGLVENQVTVWRMRGDGWGDLKAKF